MVRGGNNIGDEMMTTVTQALKEMTLESNKLRFRRMFVAVDTDKSGFIDRFEFKEAFKRLGKRATMYKVKQIINRFDTDGNGTIDEVEYMAYMEAQLRRKTGLLTRIQEGVYKAFMSVVYGEGKELPLLVPETYQYFFKMFVTECAKLGIPKLSEKIVKTMTDPSRQPKLKQGVLNLTECGITDRHFIALVRTLKRVPIIGEINVKLNSLTDESMYEMMKTFDYFAALGSKTTRETLCIGCGEEAQYGTPLSPYARCMLCGETTYRPIYFLHTLHIRDAVDGAHLQKWCRHEFEQDSTRLTIEWLRDGPPLARSEFEDKYFLLLREAIKVFRKEAYRNRFTKQMTKVKAKFLVHALCADFWSFGRERLGNQLVRYYEKAAYEIHAAARSARIATVREARDWFRLHAIKFNIN